jgi:phosphoribosyl-AMP cyclohydrolase
MNDRERDLLGVDEMTYDSNGLIPAVVQDAENGDVLMVAYMNRESLIETIQTGRTWFWSRSRQKYWMKGESSGNTQDVVEIRYDCDADCLLVRVNQNGPGACHTNERSCFYRRLYPEARSLSAGSSEE